MHPSKHILGGLIITAIPHRLSQPIKAQTPLLKSRKSFKKKKMKTLRRLCTALVLTITLTLSIYAGHIPCGVTDGPPPPASQTATTGEIATDVIGQMATGATATDPVTETLLSLFQSLLSLFYAAHSVNSIATSCHESRLLAAKVSCV
jgi:hypothetical protein